ncbi:hypothetical protein BDN72DRAFT_768358 [Pluteus cervinus]|uniref:Uncharacterized protein n=1 Tax=Pluteus cervinus TaxID=181527 RepID=A0ACD3AT47_9AGAR|nr:hypothetical protein BDN72DRAFT_768358 [Pluteus cervinus]
MDIYIERPLPLGALAHTPHSHPVPQYDSWKELLPSLVKPFLHYMSCSTGVPVTPSNDLISTCQLGSCSSRTLKLVQNGLFPAAPVSPKLSFSLSLLEFYRAIFEQSCDAIASIANALYNFYYRRGFPILNKASTLHPPYPFRRGFGIAVQWFDALRTLIEKEVESAVTDSIARVTPPNPDKVCETDFHTGASSISKPAPQLTRGQAARFLVNRCPACFGHAEWGRSLNNGGDVHVCLDGNFHHRHQTAAGDGPKVIDPDWLLSKVQVDEVGRQMEEARSKGPKKYAPKAPDEAIDDCQDSYEAADGDKKKATTDKFDDHGLVFLVCRHDIPLFFTNIDTPGEQQKYAVALLLHLFSLLPPEATVSSLYDIACVLERSIKRYGFLPEDTIKRLQFATSVLHAYGHHWACQLAYNPRIRHGLGLTDGEGVERLWSRMRKLIGIERSQWRSKRLWLIDRQATAIAIELRNDIGSWLTRRNTRGIRGQGNEADNIVHKSGFSVSVLQEEWETQREAQAVVRNRKYCLLSWIIVLICLIDAPARLTAGVGRVFSIQTQIEEVLKSIASLKDEILNAQEPSSSSLQSLSSLEKGHVSLIKETNDLYLSLNLPDSLPGLKGHSLKFTQTLMLARDLKINIRKRAIGSFFEWDRLDQAAGGRGQSLGTKLHQHTRKAIQKRAPALITSIRTYNRYCEQLKKLRPPKKHNIPLPSQLPTKLSDLRDDSSLLEDVWTTEIAEDTPVGWLDDPKTRSGIRGMLKKRRCEEEKSRLKIEALNLTIWYESELRGIESALRNPAYIHLRSLLLQRYREHMQLPSAWKSEFVSVDDFAKSDLTLLTELQETPGEVVDLPVDELGTDHPEEPSQEPLDPDEAIWGDLNSDEVDTQQILFNWDPVNLREDSSPIDWEIPEGLSTLVDPKKILFFSEDIRRLQNPTSRLNDTCINDGAQLLKLILSASPGCAPAVDRCAILTTWDLPRVRQNCPDDTLWRHIEGSHFWERDIWILPVHRPVEEHWVCCAIYPKQRHISLFDSLGSRQRFKDDAQDAVTLVKRMYLLAKSQGYPVDTPARLQTNSYDCGVWVLAFIASLLRGYDIPGIPEAQIPVLRERLYEAVLRVTV